MQALLVVLCCALIVAQATCASAENQVVVSDFGEAHTICLGDSDDLYYGFSIEVKNSIALQSIAYQDRSIWASRERRLSNTTEMLVAELAADGHPVSILWQGWLTEYSQEFEDVTLLGGHVYSILVHVDWQNGAQVPNVIRNPQLEGRNIIQGEAYIEDEDIAIFQSLSAWVPANGKEAPFYGQIFGYLPAIKELRYTPVQLENRTSTKVAQKPWIDASCSRMTSLSILRLYFNDEGNIAVKIDNFAQSICSEVLAGRGEAALRANWERLSAGLKKPQPAVKAPKSSSTPMPSQKHGMKATGMKASGMKQPAKHSFARKQTRQD